MEDARIKMCTDEKYGCLSLMGALMRLQRKRGLMSSFSNLSEMLAKQVLITQTLSL
jgi:hypothetical protein